jgi:hypothetical protein
MTAEAVKELNERRLESWKKPFISYAVDNSDKVMAINLVSIL